jgi:hypothetical protein
MGIVEEEADETMYWIDLSIDAGLLKRNRVQSILKETDEILESLCRLSIPPGVPGGFEFLLALNPHSEIRIPQC